MTLTQKRTALLAALVGCAVGCSGEPKDVSPTATANQAVTQVCNGMAAVYYGSTAADFDRLAAHPPEIVIPGDAVRYRPNFQLAVSKLHPAGIKVMAYINTCYANTNCPAYPNGLPHDRPLADVEGYIDTAMLDGADGVFLDEANASANSYYSSLYTYVHNNYPGKTVITNPGTAGILESALTVADIVSVECQWDSFNPTWKNNYPATRFLGVDGSCRNPLVTDPDTAANDTIAAHNNHVGYHYSTDHYTTLNTWFETYIAKPGVCTAPSGYALTVAAQGLDNGGAAVNGMFTTVKQNGTTVASGYTPFTVTLAPGTYQATMSSYQSYIFHHWGSDVNDIATSETVSLQAAQTVTAKHYTKMPGAIVPLYVYPTNAAWNTVAQTKTANPNVPIIAVANPANGPGGTVDSNYTSGILTLKNAGVSVAGYVYTSYGSRALATVEADILAWRNLYPNTTVLFLDQMANATGFESYYSTLTSYAKSHGFTMVIGNAGADTVASYVGTVDTIVIKEASGVPALTTLQGWHLPYDPKNFATLSYGVSTLDTSYVQSAKQFVRYQYITNDTAPNAWDTLPPYFATLISTLD